MKKKQENMMPINEFVEEPYVYIDVKKNIISKTKYQKFIDKKISKYMNIHKNIKLYQKYKLKKLIKLSVVFFLLFILIFIVERIDMSKIDYKIKLGLSILFCVIITIYIAIAMIYFIFTTYFFLESRKQYMKTQEYINACVKYDNINKIKKISKHNVYILYKMKLIKKDLYMLFKSKNDKTK